jgi:hypothetical protein
MIKPLTRIVGGKPIKIKALTQIIPARKMKSELKSIVSMFAPIVPGWMLEFDGEHRHYLVPKSMFDVLVSDQDVDDWNYLLERFNNLLGNLTKILNNIRKIDYNKIIVDKLLEQEIRNRRIKVTEKLLEKEQEGEKKKRDKASPQTKIDNLTQSLMAIGFAAAAPMINRNAPPAKADFVEIANKLKNKYRLKDFQAAAIVGTWMQEGLGKGRPDDIEDAYAAQYGDFGPPPIGSTRVGYGWAQWTNMAPGGRLDRVAAGIGVTDRAWTNNDNMKAFDWELQNTFPSLIKHLKDTQDIDEAVQLFVHIYEAGGNIQNFVNMHGASFLPRRIQSAESVLSGMTKPNATGAILIPQLMNSFIWYNTDDKTDDLANFIVDKPTIIDVNDVGEPMVVIPTERPIGQEILSILFKEPFRKIERIFEKRQQEAKPQTPIENNTTSIKRSPIPVSETPEPTRRQSPPTVPTTSYTTDTSATESFESIVDRFDSSFSKTSESLLKFTQPSVSNSMRKISNIDTVSQKTENVFGPKVILMTQDIYVTEE